jgi:quercetin dioxygenase-like cupin family protein
VRVDEDLGVNVRTAERGERGVDAVESDRAGDERAGVDVACGARLPRWPTTSGSTACIPYPPGLRAALLMIGADENTTTENDMQLTKNSIETAPGPNDWFTGTVYIDTVATPSEPSRVQAASVHFTPGARTAWHTHPNGQTIYVTEGMGLCQRRGGPIEVIRPGDRVFFEPGEDHWHGAAPNRFMTHLAMQQVDDQGNAVTWGDHVADEEYNAHRSHSGPGVGA